MGINKVVDQLILNSAFLNYPGNSNTLGPYSRNRKMEVTTSDLMWGRHSAFFEDGREWEPRNVLEDQEDKEVFFFPRRNSKGVHPCITLALWNTFCSFVFYKYALLI